MAVALLSRPSRDTGGEASTQRLAARVEWVAAAHDACLSRRCGPVSLPQPSAASLAAPSPHLPPTDSRQHGQGSRLLKGPRRTRCVEEGRGGEQAHTRSQSQRECIRDRLPLTPASAVCPCLPAVAARRVQWPSSEMRCAAAGRMQLHSSARRGCARVWHSSGTAPPLRCSPTGLSARRAPTCGRVPAARCRGLLAVVAGV